MKKYDLFELRIDNNNKYDNPFFDADIYATFISPNETAAEVKAFYDGEAWKIRFVPTEVGKYEYFVRSYLYDEDFDFSGELTVEESDDRGFIEARPHEGWGLFYNNDEELLVIGDTMYNLFGVAHCGVDIEPMLQRRKEQGFNFLRIRIQSSPYHPGTPHGEWNVKNTWLWGGSAQIPDFTRFNIDYFKSVESALELIEKYDFKVELILEAWLMEYPFNNRKDFLPEYEEHFLTYVISRLSSFKCISMWSVANEYNLYAEKITSRRDDMLSVKYANRLAGVIANADPHKHPIAVHVTAAEHMQLTFKQLFENADNVDVLLMQYWGDIADKKNSQLCFPLDQEIERSVYGSGKVNIMAEYGYEVYPNSGLSPDVHNGLGEGHTRRGGWRSIFSGVHVISGFENTWGPVFSLDNEPVGANSFKHLSAFFNEYYAFNRLKPVGLEFEYSFKGHKCQQPLQLKGEGVDLLYFPEFKNGELSNINGATNKIRLFNTSNGEFLEDCFTVESDKIIFSDFELKDSENNLQDIVLVIEKLC